MQMRSRKLRAVVLRPGIAMIWRGQRLRLTGVMVALLPFDWQTHDAYFVVALLHYVLLGGMVFPLFAAFYYWAPTVSGRTLSLRLRAWVCGLFFAGVNLAFFPMHVSGLLGIPRRVYAWAGTSPGSSLSCP